MARDPRERRLLWIKQRMEECRTLEAERDRLLRELVAERGHGARTYLAKIAGISRGRISQIVIDGRDVEGG